MPQPSETYTRGCLSLQVGDALTSCRDVDRSKLISLYYNHSEISYNNLFDQARGLFWTVESSHLDILCSLNTGILAYMLRLVTLIW